MNANGDKWAMVPKWVAIEADSDCVKTFTFLDAVQGARGRPFKGYRALAQQFGWDRERVRHHVDHLVKEGLLKVEKDGNHKAVFRVLNPARGGGSNPSTSGGSNPPTQVGGVGGQTHPLFRSYRSSNGLYDSDFELSEDGEVSERYDFNVDDMADEIAALAIDNGADRITDEDAA